MPASEERLAEGASLTRVMLAVTVEPADRPELAESWFGRAPAPPPPRPPPSSRPPPRNLEPIDDPLADAWFR